MLEWLVENYDECWEKANDIEEERTRRKLRRQNRQKASVKNVTYLKTASTISEETTRRYLKVKNLVNFVEMSRAIATLKSNGLAPINSEILQQLRAKQPKRSKKIEWPTQQEVQSERTYMKKTLSMINKSQIYPLGSDSRTTTNMRQKIWSKTEQMSRKFSGEETKSPEIAMASELSDLSESFTIKEKLPYIKISETRILQSAKAAKRSISGGIQHYTLAPQASCRSKYKLSLCRDYS